MRNLRRILSSLTLVVTVLLGAAISGASATRLEIGNHERGFRITFQPFEIIDSAVPMQPVRCTVLMEGVFTERTFTKTAALQIGNVTRARVTNHPCTAGDAWVYNGTEAGGLANSLPWGVHYAVFGGMLPNITSVSVRIVRMAFRLQPTGLAACDFTASETTVPANGFFSLISGGGGVRLFETFSFEPGVSIPQTGPMMCSLFSVRLRATESAFSIGGLEHPRMTLI